MIDPLPRRVLVLSPHCDDAVFSCGELLAGLASAGTAVDVVSVCVKGPRRNQRPTQFAMALLRSAGLSAAVASSVRLAEDKLALSIIGANARRLDIQDAIFRTDCRGRAFYPTQRSLTYLAPNDFARQTSRLARILAREPALKDPDAWVLAPSAIGLHADHSLVARTIWSMRRRIVARMIFYSDFPYALVEPKRPSGGASFAVSAHSVSQKIAGALAYRSQVRMIWGAEAQLRRLFAEFQDRNGGGAVTLYDRPLLAR